MGQVPKFTIAGRGRLSRHLEKYFRLLGKDVFVWHRELGLENLYAQCSSSTLLYVAIVDDQLDDFCRTIRNKVECPIYHGSGSKSVSGAIAFHPLMTFGQELYELDSYKKIPFAMFSDKEPIAGLENPILRFPEGQQPFYHLLCVMSGNFTQILWKKTLQEFERMNVPRDQLKQYALQNIENIFRSEAALSGPLARGDQSVIEQHLKLLEGDHWQQIYKAFVDVYQEESV